ncbi:hypothetical protein QJQ45_028327, partial [Haematococcus lacustris]
MLGAESSVGLAVSAAEDSAADSNSGLQLRTPDSGLQLQLRHWKGALCQCMKSRAVTRRQNLRLPSHCPRPGSAVQHRDLLVSAATPRRRRGQLFEGDGGAEEGERPPGSLGPGLLQPGSLAGGTLPSRSPPCRPPSCPWLSQPHDAGPVASVRAAVHTREPAASPPGDQRPPSPGHQGGAAGVVSCLHTWLQQQGGQALAAAATAGQGLWPSGRLDGGAPGHWARALEGISSLLGSGSAEQQAGEREPGAPAQEVEAAHEAAQLVAYLGHADPLMVQGALVMLMDCLASGQLSAVQLLSAGLVPALAPLLCPTPLHSACAGPGSAAGSAAAWGAGRLPSSQGGAGAGLEAAAAAASETHCLACECVCALLADTAGAIPSALSTQLLPLLPPLLQVLAEFTDPSAPPVPSSSSLAGSVPQPSQPLAVPLAAAPGGGPEPGRPRSLPALAAAVRRPVRGRAPSPPSPPHPLRAASLEPAAEQAPRASGPAPSGPALGPASSTLQERERSPPPRCPTPQLRSTPPPASRRSSSSPHPPGQLPWAWVLRASSPPPPGSCPPSRSQAPSPPPLRRSSPGVQPRALPAAEAPQPCWPLLPAAFFSLSALVRLARLPLLAQALVHGRQPGGSRGGAGRSRGQSAGGGLERTAWQQTLSKPAAAAAAAGAWSQEVAGSLGPG